jgi:hypothetical protein
MIAGRCYATNSWIWDIAVKGSHFRRTVRILQGTNSHGQICIVCCKLCNCVKRFDGFAEIKVTTYRLACDPYSCVSEELAISV